MSKVPKEVIREARDKLMELTNPGVKIVMPTRFVNDEGGDRPFTEIWTVVPIEGFCFIDLDWKRKREKYDYVMTDSDDPKDWEKIPNPEYAPEVKRNEIPAFCLRKVCYNCLEKGCEYFAYAECTDDSEKIAKVHDIHRKV